jgi:hypothetical protein
MGVGINKNIFDRLGDLKNEIKDRILHNQELLKLLKYDNEDPLSNPDISMDDVLNMVGGDGNIFFQPRAVDTIETNKSIITMKIQGRSNRIGTHHADISLIFVALVNYNCNELIDGTDRINRIGSCIKNLFDDTTGAWEGKILFKSFGDVTCPVKYASLGLEFTLTDFK